jgi:hypothetical protein
LCFWKLYFAWGLDTDIAAQKTFRAMNPTDSFMALGLAPKTALRAYIVARFFRPSFRSAISALQP